MPSSTRVVTTPKLFTIDSSTVDIQIKYCYYNISRPPIIISIFLKEQYTKILFVPF